MHSNIWRVDQINNGIKKQDVEETYTGSLQRSKYK